MITPETAGEQTLGILCAAQGSARSLASPGRYRGADGVDGMASRWHRTSEPARRRYRAARASAITAAIPLARSIYVYSTARRARRWGAPAFLRYVLSRDGQRLVAELTTTDRRHGEGNVR